MSGPLAGRTALVTGAGRGLGATVAEALAREGAAVLLAARTEAEIEAVAERLRSAGAEARALACDVTDEASVARLASAALEGAGVVDVLVNNAGDAVAAPIAKITLAEWNRMLAVNATGAFLCTRAFAPAMAGRGWGRIVNVASVAGLHGARYVTHYTAAKHALVGFTRAAAVEFEGTGVAVHAVCPGYLDTPMTARNVEAVARRTGLAPDRALQSMLSSAGQRRLVAPEEVAAAIVRLCLADTRGEIVTLTGGDERELPFEIVNPPALGAPKGWSNGVVARPGARVLFVAGQAGWTPGLAGDPPDFATQFARALDQALEVVRGAGGEARDVARLTVYVTDLEEYRAARRELGRLWRERFGTYYPAMALVRVAELVDHGARVEIEATAVLGGTR